MPGPLFDCYVLAPERTARLALEFLQLFLPEREPAFAAKDPAEVLGLRGDASIEEVLAHLERHRSAAYSFYWSNLKGIEPYHAILAFNADGSLILGLSPTTDDHADMARRYLSNLEEFVGGQEGLLGVEQAPPDSRQKFQDLLGAQRGQ